ncbi:MAG TPA: NUDIX hydrolase [Verrucomicrobiales bacterium]|nr:NUDIX hydrolase [Verrucomicrobiales bacterium]HRJ08570.1 NUDIX domain-containing protein [Prosthecobacter sp.]HRK13331.1 NUDIX domain-containing protein [Prosthecobacter sp.]
MIESKPYSLSVKAVILDDSGRCLLLRRAGGSTHFPGCWEWPGGKLDPGESFSAGLEREVLEECGLNLELTGLAGAMEFDMPRARVVALCMEARAGGGALRLSDEHEDAAWVSLSRLKKHKLPGPQRAFMLDYAARKSTTS